MSRPSLLIVSFSPIASDARVLKQIELFRKDYVVTTCGHGPSPAGVAEHLRVPDEFAVWRYDRKLIVARQFRWAYRTNPAIVAARELLARRSFDAVIANDVDAVGLALEVPSKGVHADLHEYAPRQKEELRRWRVFVAPFVRWMCSSYVSRASSVTTVGEGIARAYGDEFGINAQVVTNAAPYADLEPTVPHRPIRLVHSGAALRDRNIDTILLAVERADTEVTLDLYLTPNDPLYLAELRARQSARITIHEPVPYSELGTVLNAHDVGVHVLAPVNFNNRWALPNKFFDYVEARLGLIIGPSPEMERIVRANALGIVSDDFSVEALVRAIRSLTIETVAGYKAASARVARELSSENQVLVWADAVAAIAARNDVPASDA
jgi:hypothetical protein